MVLSKSNFTFSTPENLYHDLQPVAAISVPNPISWADEERDLTAWLGNELQDEAFAKLYSYESKVRNCSNPGILKDWQYLQTSNHFYYMCTKWFSAGEVHKYFNPYSSPYEAFINYMNVLSDFMIRVDESADAAFVESTVAPVPALADKKPVKRIKKDAKAKTQSAKVKETATKAKSQSAKVKKTVTKAKTKPEKITKAATKAKTKPGKTITRDSGQLVQSKNVVGRTTEIKSQSDKKVKKKSK